MRTTLVALTLLITLPDLAPAQSMDGVIQLQVKTRKRFRVVHPERFVHVRSDTERGQDPDKTDKVRTFSLVDLKDQKVVEPKFGVGQLHDSLAAELIDGKAFWLNKVGHKFSTFDVQLASYDPDNNRAGLWLRNDVKDKAKKTFSERHLYVAWDLKKNKPTWHVKVADSVKTGEKARYEYYMHDLGPGPKGAHHWFWSSEKVQMGPIQAAKLIIYRLNIQAQKVDWTYSFTTPPSTNEKIHAGLRAFASPDRGRLVFGEYWEKGDEHQPPPAFHVVDTTANSHFSLESPPTAYGVAIDSTNSWLVVGSNQLGQLTRYDLKKKKKDKVRKSIRRIHKLAVSPDQKWLYVLANAKIVEVRSWPALNKIKRLKAGQLLKGEIFLAPEKGAQTADGRWMVLPPTTDDYGFAEEMGVHIVEVK